MGIKTFKKNKELHYLTINNGGPVRELSGFHSVDLLLDLW